MTFITASILKQLWTSREENKRCTWPSVWAQVESQVILLRKGRWAKFADNVHLMLDATPPVAVWYITGLCKFSKLCSLLLDKYNYLRQNICMKIVKLLWSTLKDEPNCLYYLCQIGTNGSIAVGVLWLEMMLEAAISKIFYFLFFGVYAPQYDQSSLTHSITLRSTWKSLMIQCIIWFKWRIWWFRIIWYLVVVSKR